MRTTPTEFAQALPRPSDDVYFRLQMQAEARAKRNGHPNPAQAGRDAVELRRTVVAQDHEPNPEYILTVTCGEYRRCV